MVKENFECFKTKPESVTVGKMQLQGLGIEPAMLVQCPDH